MGVQFKKGDNVIVIAGADKGKTGNIISVLKDGESFLVEGVKVSTIHKKPTSSAAGQIIKKESPIHRSNISHVEAGKPVKVKFTLEKNSEKKFSKKSRVSKKSNNKI